MRMTPLRRYTCYQGIHSHEEVILLSAAGPIQAAAAFFHAVAHLAEREEHSGPFDPIRFARSVEELREQGCFVEPSEPGTLWRVEVDQGDPDGIAYNRLTASLVQRDIIMREPLCYDQRKHGAAGVTGSDEVGIRTSGQG